MLRLRTKCEKKMEIIMLRILTKSDKKQQNIATNHKSEKQK